MKYRTNQLTKHPPGLLHCRHEAPGAGGPHKQLRDHQDPAGQRGQSTLSSPPQVPGELAVPTQHSRFDLPMQRDGRQLRQMLVA